MSVVLLRARSFAVVMLLGLSSLACRAQRYTFQQYIDGIGNLNIKSLYQDRAGYLWVGTFGGLFRFNGHRFDEFGPAQGLTEPGVEDMQQDGSGHLWVATSHALFVGENGRFQSVLLDGKPPATSVGSRLARLPTGEIVFSGNHGLLRAVGPDTAGAWHLEPLLAPRAYDADTAATFGVASGNDGSVWFGCGKKICRYKNGSIQKLGDTDGLVPEHWDYLLLDRSGALWVRGRSHIEELRKGDTRFISRDIPGAPPALDFRPLGLDSSDRILAPYSNSLARFDGNSWRTFGEVNGLSGETVTEAFVDREGSVWLGNLGQGLSRWLGYDRFEHWTKTEGLGSNIVWREVRDNTGRIWLGDERGVSTLAPGSTHLQRWTRPGMPEKGLAGLTVSRDGYVWIGFRNRSIIRVDSRTNASVQMPVGDLSQLTVDAEDRVWAATLTGLFVSRPASGGGHRTGFERVEGGALPPGGFEDLEQAEDGRLWAACDDGLVTYGPEGWQRVELNWQELGTRGLLDATPDRNGDVWVDGAFSGVVRVHWTGGKTSTSTRFTRPTLTSDRYVLIARDRTGRMWFGGDRGLDTYDGREWRSLMREDGLIWNDIAAKGFFADNDGSFWVGTGGGVSHLSKLPPVPVLPKPVISSVRVGNRVVPLGSDLPWSHESLQIEIAPLEFAHAREMHLRYRMDGLETEWTDTTEQELRYSAIPPGTYELKVQAVSQADGLTSGISSLNFKVLPPWWKTSTALAVFSVGGIGLLLFGWVWSHHQILRRQQRLQQLVHERTRQLQAEKADLLEAKAVLAQQASHDGLTSLLNRSAVVEQLRCELDRCALEQTSLTIVLLDVDHFKQVNDLYGHLAGDDVLRELGRRLLTGLRSYDHCGRYGGEEFLVLLPTLPDSKARVQELFDHLTKRPFLMEHGSLQITCSFGAVHTDCGQDTPEAWLGRADRALYAAKHSGRNRIEFATNDSPNAICSEQSLSLP